MMSNRPLSSCRRIAGALIPAVLLAAACTQSVKLTVESEIPIPVVSRIPVSMGIYYDEALRSHVYKEDSEDRPDWQIESGASQVALFDQVLPSMFQNTSHVEGVPVTGAGGGVDGVISPKVEEMQFALPSETKSGLYEVWIKYSIRLYRPDGQLVAEWPVTGYGKTSEEFLKSKDEGLQAAINLALRDAGAKLALGFEQVADVRGWLATTTRDCEKYADLCHQ